MIKPKKFAALVCAGLIGITAAQKADAAFSAGDLILSFQATSGVGSNTTYIVNLGAGTIYRDATSNSLNLINIGVELDSIYGITAGSSDAWYERADLYWNIVGVRAGGYSAPNPGVVNGDTRATIYASRSRSALSTNSSAYSFGASSLDVPAGTITGYNATAATALASSSNASIPTSTINTIEDYTTPGELTVNNFGLFSNDFSQAFGTGAIFGSFQGALDLQRLNRSNTTTGAFAGNVVVPGVAAGTGSNEGTFTIDSLGNVSYYNAIPEPSTYALVGLGLAAAGIAVRRRKQKLS